VIDVRRRVLYIEPVVSEQVDSGKGGYLNLKVLEMELEATSLT